MYDIIMVIYFLYFFFYGWLVINYFSRFIWIEIKECGILELIYEISVNFLESYKFF